MALKEIAAVLRGLLADGNEGLIYPITKAEYVDGLQELVDARKPIYFDTTIGTTWTGTAAPYSQNITVNGILAADKPVMYIRPSDDVAASQSELEDFGQIQKFTTSANRITVKAFEKTTVAIPITLEVRR